MPKIDGKVPDGPALPDNGGQQPDDGSDPLEFPKSRDQTQPFSVEKVPLNKRLTPEQRAELGEGPFELRATATFDRYDEFAKYGIFDLENALRQDPRLNSENSSVLFRFPNFFEDSGGFRNRRDLCERAYLLSRFNRIVSVETPVDKTEPLSKKQSFDKSAIFENGEDVVTQINFQYLLSNGNSTPIACPSRHDSLDPKYSDIPWVTEHGSTAVFRLGYGQSEFERGESGLANHSDGRGRLEFRDPKLLSLVHPRHAAESAGSLVGRIPRTRLSIGIPKNMYQKFVDEFNGEKNVERALNSYKREVDHYLNEFDTVWAKKSNLVINCS